MSITAVRLRNLSAEFDTPASDRTSLASPTTSTRIRIPLAKLTYSEMVLPNYFHLCNLLYVREFNRISRIISFRGRAPKGGTMQPRAAGRSVLGAEGGWPCYSRLVLLSQRAS